MFSYWVACSSLLVCPIITAATYLEIYAGITSKYFIYSTKSVDAMSCIQWSNLSGSFPAFVPYMGIRAGLVILAAMWFLGVYVLKCSFADAKYHHVLCYFIFLSPDPCLLWNASRCNLRVPKFKKFPCGGRQISLKNDFLQCIIFHLAKAKVPPNIPTL